MILIEHFRRMTRKPSHSFHEKRYAHGHLIRSSLKVLIVLSVSFLLIAMETWAKSWVAVLGILITAPLGALGIDLSDKRLLKQQQ